MNILPEDIIITIQAFANESTRQKRLMIHAIYEFLDDLPHGKRMAIYDLIADEWQRVTGEDVSGRTVRYWVESVRNYTREQMEKYQPLTDAQLIEAVKLANDCQNEFTPQDICEWAVSEQVGSVREMRAHWLPSTGTAEAVDPPALSGVIRWLNKLFGNNNPHRKRIEEIITELRGYLMEAVS